MKLVYRIVLGLIAVALIAQVPFTVVNVAPSSVTNATTSIIGQPGIASYVYWIIANKGVYKASPFRVTANFANATLTGSNFVRVTWQPVSNATSYDVLKSNNYPSGTSTIALATGITTTQLDDTGQSLSSYTYVQPSNPIYVAMGNMAITSPTINNETWVDGSINPDVVTAFNNTPNGGTVHIPPGNFGLASGLTEPEASIGISLVGAGSDKTSVIATAAMTSMLFKGDTIVGNFQIKGITFLCNNGTTVNAQYGLRLQFARGLVLQDVLVKNCGTEDIAFGSSTTSHPFGAYVSDIQTDYNEGVFTTPQGGTGGTPPNYSIHLYPSAVDSVYRNVTVRNAQVAGLRFDVGASNNTWFSLHGFGFNSNPVYQLAYSPNYVIEDAAGGNNFFDTYMDGVKISGIHIATTGTSANETIIGGRFYWPGFSGVTWPSTANFMTIDTANTTDITLMGQACFGLPSSSPITGSLSARSTFAFIAGCSAFMSYRFNPTNRAWLFSSRGQVGTFDFEGRTTVRPTTSNGTDGLTVFDSSGVRHAGITDAGVMQLPDIKSTTGTRYVCVDTAGNITSSATACSGT